MTETVPYGAWPSPISAELLATGAVGLSEPRWDRHDACWLELRPSESGRLVLVVQGIDAVPADFNVRTLVHEYGGGSYIVRDGVVFAASFTDQRWYRIDPGRPPRPITPEPASPRRDRYADPGLTPDGRRLYLVRERHHAAREATNELVMVHADGRSEPRAVATGNDFYAAPRVSPDGRHLAFLTWDHPNMPWDGTQLVVAALHDNGTPGEPHVVAGGPRESVVQPEWGPDGRLHFASDRTGWWNLYRVEDDGAVTALCPDEAEYSIPQWVFGTAQYAFLADGRIVAIRNAGGRMQLGLVADARFTPFPLPYTRMAGLHSDGRRLLLVAAGPATSPVVARIDDVDDPQPVVLKRASSVDIEPGVITEPEPISFTTTDGATAHAIYYPPRNDAVSPPADERPPLLVLSHGGPTAQVHGVLSTQILFWTSRGFAVVDVNYGGSTGYGRAYRERLNGQWGVVDLDDCVAAARWLVQRDDVDASRVAIRGGSAGGWTTLCALVFSDAFAAGANYFGVADLTTFVEDTHKFESRYLDTLIGPWPEAAELYRERSPLTHADRLSCPLIVFQGLEDKIVPPSQSEQIVAALAAKGIPHAYLAFEGEQHGFRKADSIRRAAEAELSFYGQVFGFTPAGDVEAVELRS